MDPIWPQPPPPRVSWRDVPPNAPPPNPASFPVLEPPRAQVPVWLQVITAPIWIPFMFIAVIVQSFGHMAPPNVDMRMNDPLWVLYDPETGRVDRGEDRYRNGRTYNSRGTDSDGSGMM